MSRDANAPGPLYEASGASHWIDALRHPEAAVRQEAAGALSVIGRDTPEAVLALGTALADADEHVRTAAAIAPGCLAPAAPRPVLAPAEALPGPDHLVP